MREEKSFCRICSGGCGVRVTVGDDGRVASIQPDHDHPMSRGHACFKGLQAHEALNSHKRLLHARKRDGQGGFARIGTEQAFDEIGATLRAIIERDGPQAVGLYCGNGSMGGYVNFAMQRAFMAAIGSTQRFTTFTIDQSAKFVSFERLGGWAGGTQQLETSDVVMMFGTNPLISHSAQGVLCVDPVKRLRQARARGLKLIVIDPRHTETARHADVFLQPLPGQDTAIAAGMLRMILAEGWHDADFCARFVGADRMARLAAEVEPFTPEVAEARAGLNPGDLRRAAEVFARDSRRGVAITATGPNMAPWSNLSQHLVDCLNVVCGRFPRAGEEVVAIDVLDPPPAHLEAVIPAPRNWNAVPPSRIRGVGMLYGERLTGTLADEILTPGEGQIRALIVSGGNPANSIPDQRKIVAALKSLELLVVIDTQDTITAGLADYVIGATHMYERPDLPLSIPGMAFWPVAWTQYTPAVVQPPPGSDVVDDWYVLWSLAQRLGRTVRFDDAVDIDMRRAPRAEDLVAIRARRSAVPLEEIRSHPGGHVFDLGTRRVQAAPDSAACFDVMPDDVAAELRAAHAQTPEPGFTHLLASRRMRDLFNSIGYYQPGTRRRNPFNPAGLAPADMQALGLSDGDEVEIASDHGAVRAFVRGDASLRSGVITLSHGWGELPDAARDPRGAGTNINPLISDARHVDAVNAMPRMSAIPVNIRRV